MLARRCLDQRTVDEPALAPEVAAWEAARNDQGIGADWGFTNADVQIRLKRWYWVVEG